MVSCNKYKSVSVGARLGVGLTICLYFIGACSSSDNKGDSGTSVASGGGGATGGSFGFGANGGGTGLISGNGGAGGAGALPSTTWPPEGFINVTDTELGAYALGPEYGSNSGAAGATSWPGISDGTNCSGLFAVVRDFKMGNNPGGHLDFETNQGGDDRGIVEDTLGADNKPVYAHGAEGTMCNSSQNTRVCGTQNQELFDQWYRDVSGVNRSFVLGLHLVQNGSVYSFQSDAFFPLDDQGWGNEYQSHNYSFTTEIHTAFQYKGGETFTFIGDDDVWVFINRKLVIDLGGRHSSETGKVDLDAVAQELDLVVGQTYELAVFHAERHTVESHFRIDSTLTFVDCGQIPELTPPA